MIVVIRDRIVEARAARWLIVAAALLAFPSAAAEASRSPPLRDPVTLNIGINCQWQKPCIDKQRRAMKRALAFVKKKNPPLWKIQQCNRNASRRGQRVDWVGYDHCIRNPGLRYMPPTTPASLRKNKRRSGARARPRPVTA